MLTIFLIILSLNIVQIVLIIHMFAFLLIIISSVDLNFMLTNTSITLQTYLLVFMCLIYSFSLLCFVVRYFMSILVLQSS